jgi:hypothetical protein
MPRVLVHHPRRRSTIGFRYQFLYTWVLKAEEFVVLRGYSLSQRNTAAN